MLNGRNVNLGTLKIGRKPGTAPHLRVLHYKIISMPEREKRLLERVRLLSERNPPCCERSATTLGLLGNSLSYTLPDLE